MQAIIKKNSKPDRLPNRWITLFFLLTMCGQALGQNTQVPLALQAGLFKKIFRFDPILQGTTPLKVLVVFNGSSTKIKEEVVDAFEAVGISATPVKDSQLLRTSKEDTVAYLMPGVVSLKRLCEQRGLLSITGTPEMVESGEASIGLEMKRYQPKIIVHLEQLKAEGHSLSSKVLKLARVIR